MSANHPWSLFSHSHQYSTDSASRLQQTITPEELEAGSAPELPSNNAEVEPKAYDLEDSEKVTTEDSNPKTHFSETNNTRLLPSKVRSWFRKKDNTQPPILPEHKQDVYTPTSSPSIAGTETPEEIFADQYLVSHHNEPDNQRPPSYTDEARNLVRTLTAAVPQTNHTENSSGHDTPTIDRYLTDLDYVAPPGRYKPSVFATILSSKLSTIQHSVGGQRDNNTPPKNERNRWSLLEDARPRSKRRHSMDSSPQGSGTHTPSKKIRWYDKPEHSSMAQYLVQATMSSASPAMPGSSEAAPKKKLQSSRASERFSSGAGAVQGAVHRHQKTNSTDLDHELEKEVADIIARRNYLTKLCGALMKCGAPTHRLEAYLSASARALWIEAEFLYIPGAMVCTFIDHSILANNVEVVRKPAGLDFGKLKDVFNVYKNVIHEKFTAQEGILELDNIQKRPDRHNQWFRVLIFGLASVVVGPFSFNSRPIDFIPIFVLGCALGFMQIKVVPKSEQLGNVFEVFACVIIAFLARALGSIRWPDGTYVFCFSAVAQSSIAMILPGFLVLNSALELQGKNMVSGSVRMIYAIIYVLFLGFGLLVGTTIFGLIKRDAVDSVTCEIPAWFYPESNYKLLYTRFVWVPLFAACVALMYQAKWRQLPVMCLIAVAGHQANYWISTQLSSNLQVANAIGAFVIGCLANLYSRMFHGLAAAAMLPAIYCAVPGGLAASGSLVAGVASSNQIIGNSSAISVINNGTQGFVQAQNDPSSVYGGTIYNAGYGMVQVSIGISVGLYLSALVIYPFGKRRSGLFSF